MQDADFIRRTEKRCRDAKWAIGRTSSGHYVFTPHDPTKRPVYVSGTPSSQTYRDGVRADLRRSGLPDEHAGKRRRTAKPEPEDGERAEETTDSGEATPSVFTSFGAAVSATRQRMGFTIEEFAAYFDVQPRVVEDWEAGRSTGCPAGAYAALREACVEVRRAPEPDLLDDAAVKATAEGLQQEEGNMQAKTMTTHQTFGAALKAKRIETGRSVNAMAMVLGIGAKALPRYEADGGAMTQMIYERIVGHYPDLKDAPRPRIAPGHPVAAEVLPNEAKQTPHMEENTEPLGVFRQILALRKAVRDGGIPLAILKAAAEEGLSATELYAILAA